MSRLIAINGARYPLAIFPHDEPNRPETPEDAVTTSNKPRYRLRSLRCYIYQTKPCGGYPTRSETLFAFLTMALRQRVAEEAIIVACLDNQYVGKGIHTHIRDNHGEPYLKTQIARARGKIKQPAPQQKTMELVCAKDVIMRGVNWVWYGQLARANLELMTGVPDMENHKSIAALLLVLRPGVTGRMGNPDPYQETSLWSRQKTRVIRP